MPKTKHQQIKQQPLNSVQHQHTVKPPKKASQKHPNLTGKQQQTFNKQHPKICLLNNTPVQPQKYTRKNIKKVHKKEYKQHKKHNKNNTTSLSETSSAGCHVTAGCHEDVVLWTDLDVTLRVAVLGEVHELGGGVGGKKRKHFGGFLVTWWVFTGFLMRFSMGF